MEIILEGRAGTLEQGEDIFYVAIEIKKICIVPIWFLLDFFFFKHFS